MSANLVLSPLEGKHRLYSQQLNSYFSLIIWMLKLKMVRWAVHVADMEEMRNIYNILVRILTHDGKRTPTDQGSRLPSGMNRY
jgi:hypothetical protein